MINSLSDEGLAVVVISSYLPEIMALSDRILVSRLGRIVEEGTRDQIFEDPQHPYTLALFAALPRPSDKGRALASIRGQVPAPDAMPSGCRFAPRCPFAIDRCRAERPPLAAAEDGHRAACWRAPLEESVQ